MSDQPPRPSHSITFHRQGSHGRYIEAIATTDTQNPDNPIEIVRPYGGGDAGNEVLVSLTTAEWTELVCFAAQHSVSVAAILEELERRGVYAKPDDTETEATP